MRGYIFIIIAALLFWFPGFAEKYTGHTGKFLIAYDIPVGNMFEDSVVYVIDHKVMGALGVILGRPIAKDVLKAQDTIPEEIKALDIPIYMGGPVGLDDGLFVLQKDHLDIGKETWVAYSLNQQTEEDRAELIAKAIADYDESVSGQNYMLFIGYASWAPIQLDFEVFNKAWLVLDEFGFTLGALSSKGADKLWRDGFNKVTEKSKKKMWVIY